MGFQDVVFGVDGWSFLRIETGFSEFFNEIMNLGFHKMRVFS
jgi:hypothetical protein